MSDPLDHHEFLVALRHANARTAATARTLDELPAIPAEWLKVFVEAGIVREGVQGTYFVEDRKLPSNAAISTPTPYTPTRVALMIGVWLVVLFVPLLVWLLAR
jgi:hypothetical protein